MTPIELLLGAGALALYPIAGPAASAAGLMGAAFVAVTIRRHREFSGRYQLLARREALFRDVDLNDRMLGQTIGDYLLVRRVGCWRGTLEYLACPTSTLEMGEAVTLLLCESPYSAPLPALLKEWTAVNHPLFLPILDWGDYNGDHFVIFQRPQEKLTARLPVPLERVGETFLPLFEGLARWDPGQFGIDDLYLEDGRPVLDFVWRPPARPSDCQAAEWGTSNFTLAPEEVAGQPSTAALQFRIGVILYQALAGHHPFDTADGDVMHLIMATLQQDPAPLNLASQSLEAFVMRLLSKDPQDRYPDLPSAASALKALL